MKVNITMSEAISKIEDGIIVGLGMVVVAGLIVYHWVSDR